MDGKIDLNCDVSAEDYEKRADFDEMWPKMRLIFCSICLLIKVAK